VIDLMDALKQSLAKRAGEPGVPAAMEKKPPVKVVKRPAAATSERPEKKVRAGKK
jgi:hypothetical protein